jgi:alkylhydroperoxidase/carboxymuconolactone decarboxylase family protein YurZ
VALDTLRRWDPEWAETCLKMTSNPSGSAILPRKTVELIGVALNADCVAFNIEGTRRHVRAALEAGASKDEILMVLKMASVMAIRSARLGAPLLLEAAISADLDAFAAKHKPSSVRTPAYDEVKAAGRWNDTWDPIYLFDPQWTDEFLATEIGIYKSGLMPLKLVELLSIALDASYRHLYPSGARRHIRAALKAGASAEEIMEVLKLCVVQGVQACNLGVPILEEELAKLSVGSAQS